MKKRSAILLLSLATLSVVGCGSNQGNNNQTQTEKQYSLILNYDQTKGSVNVDNTSGKVGEKIKVSIAPNNGYSIDTVTFNGKNVDAVESLELTPVEGSNTLAVTFKSNSTVETTFSINVSYEASQGSVTLSKSSGNVGEKVTATITTKEGYEIDAITFNSTSVQVASVVELTPVGGTNNLSVTFKSSSGSKDQTTFTLSGDYDSAQGSVSFDKTSGNVGDKVKVTIAPNSGYGISSITLNGQSLTVSKEFEITPIGGNNTLKVLFSIADYTSGWNTAMREWMLEEFGEVLPYVNLGGDPSSGTYVSDDNYYYINGTSKFSDSILSKAISNFTNGGWKISSQTTVLFEASLSDSGLRVTLSTNEDTSAVVMKVYVTDVYKPETATSWPSTFDTFFADYLDGHTIPCLYLGTRKPTIEVESNYGGTPTVVISGAPYDERMLAENTTRLQNDPTGGWVFTDSSELSSFYPLEVTKVFDDKCEISILLLASGNAAKLYITYEEGFYPLTGDDAKWSDDVIESMKYDLFDHTLPYVYLGAKKPTVDSYDDDFLIVGNVWDASILTSAKEVFENAGYVSAEIQQDNQYDASKTFDDGVTISITINKNSSQKPQLRAKATEAWDETIANAWSEDITGDVDILKAFGTTDFIPYIYLGTRSPSARYSNGYLTITGGDWNDRVLDLATETFGSSNGWTPFVDKTTQCFAAYKKFDEMTQVTTIVNNSGTIVLKTLFNVNLPGTKTEWNSNEKALLSEHIGCDIPFFESIDVKSRLPEWVDDANVGYFQCVNTVNTTLAASEALSKAGWTVKLSPASYGLTLKATKSDGDNNLTVYIGATSSSYNNIYIKNKKTYVNKDGSWDETVSSQISKLSNGVEIPYLYLGSDNVKSSVSSNVLTIKGGFYNDDMASAFDTKFSTEDGWVKEVVNGDRIATKSTVDGDVIVRLTESYLTGSSVEFYKEDAIATLTISFVDTYNPDSIEEKSWDSSITANLNKILNNNASEIPYVYLGTKNPTSTNTTLVDTDGIKTNYTSIIGGAWNYEVLSDAKEIFDNNGYYSYITTGNYSNALYSYKKLADGSYILLKLESSAGRGKGMVEMDVFMFGAIGKSPETNWDSSILNSFSEYLGDYTIPYFYMGANSSEFETSNYVCNFGSNSLSSLGPTNFLNAAEVLRDNGWETNIKLGFDYYNKRWKITVGASKEVETGKLIASLEYDSYSNKFDFYCNLNEKFNSTTELTDWASTTKRYIHSNLGNDVDVPFIYLGLDEPTSSYNYADNSVTLTGQGWDDSILENAEKAFKEDTTYSRYTYYESDGTFVALTQTSSGKNIKVELAKSTSSHSTVETGKMVIYSF